MTNTNCPSCSWMKNDKRARVTSFTLGDGITHYAPDMWLAGRTTALRLEGITNHMEAARIAIGQWADQCDMQQQHEAQRAARRAA